MFKKYIQKKLQVRAAEFLRKNPQIKVVAVVGSIGKTTTKHHIGTLLSAQYRIRMHEGGFNSDIGAPLAILGLNLPPKLRSMKGWFDVMRAANYEVKRPADFDVLVLELGVGEPGDMANFARYVHPNIAIVTAVTPEHMEFFGTLDAVAAEELSVGNFSDQLLVNRDDVDAKYSVDVSNSNLDTYGSSGVAEYRFEAEDFSIGKGFSGKIVAPEFPDGINAEIDVVGEYSLRPVMGALAIAVKLGVTSDNIVKGLASIKPTHGRMNPLKGLKESIIVDDSYNSSPAAAQAALQFLYSVEAPQRIVLFGDMNELGATSEAEHRKLGELCDPSLLSWVVTVGQQSAAYLAPAARARGCQVKSFKSPIEAGGFVNSVLEERAVVLVKGSQGGIYLEEAIKILLHDTGEESQLVRQSLAWQTTKQKFFDSLQ